MPLKPKIVRYLALGLLLAPFPARAIVGTAYQMQLGNPSGAAADTNNHAHFLIQRPVEALDYSDNLGLPLWASWDLTAADVGTNARSSFATDSELPANFNHVIPGDYLYSGFDRGHLCPSKDRSASATDNDLVFLMSNVMPQAPVNNSGVWLQFENYCRSLVESTNNYELLITCGPSGFSGARINTNGPVFIPDYVWKIVVVVPPGNDPATNRISTTNRVIALKVPNTDSATNTWPAYVTSAAQIQVDTGFNFFTALPAEVAAALRSKVDGATNPPPEIFAFAPASGMVGTSVKITGTNFEAASAVAFNGAVAAFTVISSGQITAAVPTNGSSGFVSVTTPSGTAISSNAFTVLTSGGGTVYRGTLAAWDVSGVTKYGPSPLVATSNAPNVAVVGLTRGSGVRTSGMAAAGGWGGVAFTNLTAAAAIGSNQFATFGVTASNGYQFSCTSVSRFDYYRSPTGPTNGVLQFQVGSGAFTDITNLYYARVSAGGSIGAIDLSGMAALQNVGAPTNVTFRIVNFGGTSGGGTWYIYNTAGSTAPDLALEGVVTQLLIANVPAAAPTIAGVILTNGQVRFTVTGTAGTNYIVQATTNLATVNWVSVVTNAAPFTFSESNAAGFRQRFYRGALAP